MKTLILCVVLCLVAVPAIGQERVFPSEAKSVEESNKPKFDPEAEDKRIEQNLMGLQVKAQMIDEDIQDLLNRRRNNDINIGIQRNERLKLWREHFPEKLKQTKR